VCGICGEWNPGGVDRERLADMNRKLAHRGPDDEGVEVLDDIGLAARRLSIIDLAGGHQPIHNEDRTAWIAFNGEIYNYRELRRELLERNHRFQTSTDTEVVLHLYEEFGERVVERLRGMFALAIWDARRRRLLLARDRFGQKPLYYAWDGGRFLFASEIKAILSSLSRPPDLNIGALDDFLTLRFVPSPDTMFEGVHKLAPGHRLTLDVSRDGSPRVDARRYWNLDYLPKRKLGEHEAIEEVRRLLRDAVESHLVSDVPLGAFLSGGMDSSVVVAMMAEIMEQPVSTFAIGVKEQDFNELGFAGQVARSCGTKHHEETVWPDLVKLLPQIVYHLEEPSDPIAACMYHAAALAARHVKVVLTGDGGDEVFAGFDRYYGFGQVRYYAALPAVVRRLLLGPILGALPDSAGYKTFAQKARWAHNLSFHEGGRRYAEATAFFRFGMGEKAGVFSDETAARVAGRDAAETIVEAFESANAGADLDRMLYADIVTRLPEHSLMLTDRMTMLHSLEGRSPFLDHQLAEFVASLPTGLKLKGGRLKYLLREAAEPYLPREILRRPKQGFMFPLGYWMKGPLVPVIEHLFDSSVLVDAGVFRRDGMKRLLDEHRADKADHHVRLWMLLNLEVWYRMYFLGQPVGELCEMLEGQVEARATQ
jgi:asparagine synthase (glutamine-hydrolysing)